MDQHKEITFAKHDPAIALMPIVRPLFRKQKPKGFDIRQEFGEFSIRMAGPYYMTPLDQSVLLALLGIAGTESRLLASEPDNDAEAALRDELKCSEGAIDENTIFVDTTLYRLSHLVYSARSNERYELLQESIFRIKAITVEVSVEENDNEERDETDDGDEKRNKKRKLKRWGSSNLLSYAGGDGERVQVAVNWRLAQAVVGFDIQHVRISLEERHALNNGVAQIIHGWLSAWLKPGQARPIYTDTLAEKVYGDRVTGATQRMRRKRIRDALELINELPGWSITSSMSGTHQIRRISARGVTH